MSVEAVIRGEVKSRQHIHVEINANLMEKHRFTGTNRTDNQHSITTRG
jgi:hypothetical protein